MKDQKLINEFLLSFKPKENQSWKSCYFFSHFLKKNHNIDAIIDDTNENFSSKMKKFNLIGVPYQIILGKKSAGDLVEFKELGKDSQNLSVEQIAKILTKQKEKI